MIVDCMRRWPSAPDRSTSEGMTYDCLLAVSAGEREVVDVVVDDDESCGETFCSSSRLVDPGPIQGNGRGNHLPFSTVAKLTRHQMGQTPRLRVGDSRVTARSTSASPFLGQHAFSMFLS